MTRFGEKVKTAREALQIGQEQLGNLCGVSRRTIVSYETGGKYPRESTLRKLAEALGVKNNPSREQIKLSGRVFPLFRHDNGSRGFI